MRAVYLPLIAPLVLLGACASGNPDAQPMASIEESVRVETTEQAVALAASSKPAEADAAIQWLRARGPDGLDALLEAYSDIRSYRLGEAARPVAYDTTAADGALAAIDRVSRQFDGWASGLYWHTDREEALQAARRTGKPLLNLWLLGNLDDEFC